MNDLWAVALFAKRFQGGLLIIEVCPALIHARLKNQAFLSALALCFEEWPMEAGWIEHSASVMKIRDIDFQTKGVQ